MPLVFRWFGWQKGCHVWSGSTVPYSGADMKPTTNVAEFMRRGREAGHDALGIARDPEAIMAMAVMQRETFLRERGERSLRRWRELVAEIASSDDGDPGVERWLGIEHVRLGRAFKLAELNDATLHADATRWIAKLNVGERDDAVGRFDLDLIVAVTAATADRQG
jgi:hypothetical protein